MKSDKERIIQLQQSTKDFMHQIQVWIAEGKFARWSESDRVLLKELLQQGEEALKTDNV